MRVGVCMGVYVWCGCASVVPREGCTYVCVCAFHLLCVVGVVYVICGCACIEHAHASVPHECPKVLCVHVRVCVCVCVCACWCVYVRTSCMTVSVHMSMCVCVCNIIWECL